MSKDFDGFVEGLQDRVFNETRAVYGDILFQRWLNPLYVGCLENPDGYGRVTGSCADTMKIFLKFESGKEKNTSF